MALRPTLIPAINAIEPIALANASKDSDEITGSRIPSTMKLSGL